MFVTCKLLQDKRLKNNGILFDFNVSISIVASFQLSSALCSFVFFRDTCRILLAANNHENSRMNKNRRSI